MWTFPEFASRKIFTCLMSINMIFFINQVSIMVYSDRYYIETKIHWYFSNLKTSYITFLRVQKNQIPNQIKMNKGLIVWKVYY